MKHFLLLILVNVLIYAFIRAAPAPLRRTVGGFLMRHASPVLLILLLAALAFVATVYLGPTTIVSP